MKLARTISVRGFVIVAFALAGCEFARQAYGPTPEVAATVRITSAFTFEPRDIRIRAGEAVEWRNLSQYAHRIVHDPPKPERPGLRPPPVLFDSGLIAVGQSFRQVFPTPGVYPYSSPGYAQAGMTGTVTVE